MSSIVSCSSSSSSWKPRGRIEDEDENDEEDEGEVHEGTAASRRVFGNTESANSVAGMARRRRRILLLPGESSVGTAEDNARTQRIFRQAVWRRAISQSFSCS